MPARGLYRTGFIKNRSMTLASRRRASYVSAVPRGSPTCYDGVAGDARILHHCPEGRRMAVAPRILAVLAGVVLCTAPLSAQAVGTIRGRVLDSATSQGLTNVTVTVEGTQLGAVTQTD